MLGNAKYIITKEGKAVVFSPAFNHSDFHHLNPIRAGFVSYGIGKDGEMKCACYGKSISLNLESDIIEDTRLITNQILNIWDY